ncbi:uncharacterized protein LOC112503489 isoform X1 [Cynara cardunculus var. scolymus]|uniref:uncharacterized protein LOC112503489 isoform X1 n=1 Tax=Cynara cardunculus var. scolymus TaxID=59895 RepID=UPI000D6289C7|nr:uncharacterized protein LOC112503489 isoform X1 [Cynara cardunculus var. scolymus]
MASGEVAASLDDCIGVFSHNLEGSFCWSQTAILVQGTKVEAIRWTGSGDGLISVGIDVVLWRKKGWSWEIAWKFRPEFPQALVSTTSSIEGPFATAPLNKPQNGDSTAVTKDVSRCVLIGHGKSKYIKAELRHHVPVSMIQWRPLVANQWKEKPKHLLKLVLLTCCADGTVRLWSEIDDGRARKTGKGQNDQRPTGSSFRVAATIEINQAVNGILGSDVFVRWASELDGIVNIGKEASQYFASEEYHHGKAGKCDWLICFGPQMLVTFWAVHCIDDFSPLRFPRVTLWKRRELLGLKKGASFLLHKAVISRNGFFGPPDVCSVVHLLPCNHLVWLQFYEHTSSDANKISDMEDSLSSIANRTLNIDGHTGKILQIVLHPYGCYPKLAVSLDTDGVILFWSLSNSIMGLSALNSGCKLSGKFVVQDSQCKYTSLRWAPAIIHDHRILLMGHARGIDCFVVKVCENEDLILCHKLCTIPFTGTCDEDGPTSIWSIPLTSTCSNFLYNNFIVVAIRKGNFQALSWKITIHPSDPHNHDSITSFAVVGLYNFSTAKQEQNVGSGMFSNYVAYHMVTGCFDGSLKLWRSMAAESLNLDQEWKLVGMIASHEGPITRVSPTDCGRKIATISTVHESNKHSTLHIWESVYLGGNGSFLLEDTIYLDGVVVALNWLTIGNGQLLLGVCLQNELQVYSMRRRGGQSFIDSQKSLDRNMWFCLAKTHTRTAIRDFIWGPKATGVIVHDDYFCLFSQLLLPSNQRHMSKCHQNICEDNSFDNDGRSDRCMLPEVFSDSDAHAFETLTLKDSTEPCLPRYPIKMNMENCIFSSISGSDRHKYHTSTEIGFCSILEIAAHVGGTLPTYHPEALLVNIYSGNWKRARSSLGHLFEHLTSNNADWKGNRTAKSGHKIPQIGLLDYVEGLISTNGNANVGTSSSFRLDTFNYSDWDSNASSNSLNSTSTRSGWSGFTDSLEKLQDISAITNIEKIHILAVIDLLDEICNSNASSPYGGLDEPGRRFWVAVRFQQLYSVRRLGRLPSMGELVIDSALIGWAFHSDCQESLFESLLNNESSWHEMRNMGVGFWYTNKSQLRVKMERLAKQQYLKSKDPKACTLLYVALNRLQVLAGLFKISKDEKDKPLVAFLSRNFQEEKNKAAALKNAYVLMGRHQLELAVAFFMLGGDTAAAINICAKTLGDEQLALVICRLLEGYGGPLEHHLISKVLLPCAYENGDYWKSSFLEWILGNYSKAFLSMLGDQVNSPCNNSTLSSNHAAFINPSIGQYCLMLATKNQMKNAIGEQNTAILGRWAILMSSTALSRCGLPLEALECLSSSLSMFSASSQGSASDNSETKILNERLKPSASISSSSWMSGDVALLMLSHAKYSFALQYITNLLIEHPSWPENIIASSQTFGYSHPEIQQYNTLLSTFESKLSTGLVYFEQKYSLIRRHLINMISASLYNYGLVFIGCHILRHDTSEDISQGEPFALNGNPSYPSLPMLLLKAIEDFTYLFSRYNVVCRMTCYDTEAHFIQKTEVVGSSWCWLSSCRFYMKDLLQLVSNIRTGLKSLYGSYAENVLQTPLFLLDLCEYYIYFASAWFQKNSKSLILVLKPILLTYSNESVSFETNMKTLNKILPEIAEGLSHNDMIMDFESSIQTTRLTVNDQSGHVLPEKDKWQIIRDSLWGLLSRFLKYQIDSLPENLEDNSSVCPPCKLSSYMSSFTLPDHDNDSIKAQLQLVSVVLSKLLKVESDYALSYCAKQLASFLLQKGRDHSNESTIFWLEDLCRSTTVTNYRGLDLGIDVSKIMNNEDGLSAFEVLWSMLDDQKMLLGDFAVEYSKWSQLIKQKHSKGWSDMFTSITVEYEASENGNQEGRLDTALSANSIVYPIDVRSPDILSVNFGSKDSAIKMRHMPFQKPKEVHKINGELLEALCINSIDQQQAAIASNKKGIIFFNRKDGQTCFDKSKYIWTDVDWPIDGWAGSESIPVPTCVSPGIGLGSRKGTHLGLGGATIGVGLARPGRESTAAVSTSLGWEIQEDFEEFIDPPATVDNIRTRAFSSHPSRPFFLVGSSNTHVYLWEFGKHAATATYGVLPAANVPPPYALASISALQFDHCGQRFATAALDGTVCTWQLEVGGRSNVRPTESSLCFNNYTSDVTYVSSSGSIVAAVGYSSSNVNVVIWDTLAPPATSRASIMCHEGGARSLSVFANDIGSGSVSPLIVTGGKGGDVGVHDFRYIATGRPKRHKNSDNSEQKFNASSTAGLQNKHGDQNRNGMLWYIPKAHSGSVTRISAIPNTSFFLTGSKDGDVKLWDAKRAKLVYHWPKLHDKHTFLQPSSRGFGGVVRAAVTDIQVVSNGFLSCGGDGSVKLVQLRDI